MKFSSLFGAGARPGVAPAPAVQPDTAAKAFRSGLFGGKAAAAADTGQRMPRQARAADTPVFEEAGRSRKGGIGGFLSGAGRFMTGAHPDHIRNRAENVGATFAQRVDNFEQGKFNRLGGPLFGMGFKNYNANRPAAAQHPFAGAPAPQPAPQFGGAHQAPQAQGFAAPQAHTAAPDPAGAGPRWTPPAADPQAFRHHAQHAGNDFAARVNGFAQAGGGNFNPFAGMDAAPRPAPAAAPDPSGTGPRWTPTSVDPQGFRQHVQNAGNDFTSRVDGFARAGGGAFNPFAGMDAAPAQAARPAPPDNQARIDAARADYRSMMTRLTAEFADKKDAVELDSARQISATTANTEAIGRNLDDALRDLDANTARQTASLQRQAEGLQQQLKDMARQMRPHQAQAFAAGTDSRKAVALDGSTAAGRDRFTALSHERNQIKERLAQVNEKLARLPADTAALRSDMMAQAEDSIRNNDARIDRIKAKRTAALEGLDAGFAKARKQQMDRIASEHGVAFGPDRA